MIFSIIGYATFMVCLHQTDIYYRYLEAFSIDVKPFTCVLCSTFWFTILTSWITFGIDCIFISTSAAVLAELLDKQLHKI